MADQKITSVRPGRLVRLAPGRQLAPQPVARLGLAALGHHLVHGTRQAQQGRRKGADALAAGLVQPVHRGAPRRGDLRALFRQGLFQRVEPARVAPSFAQQPPALAQRMLIRARPPRMGGIQP